MNNMINNKKKMKKNKINILKKKKMKKNRINIINKKKNSR